MGELPDTIKPQCVAAIKEFTSSDEHGRWNSLPLLVEGEKWTARFRKYNVGSTHFIVGVIISNRDMFGNVFSSEVMIGTAMIMVSLIVLMLAFSQFQIAKQNNLLHLSNRTITEQQQEILAKNRHLNDSIAYAQTLQLALLPSMQQLKAAVPHSFVVNLPKDIVSGDFYFTRQFAQLTYVAVADCTGHGVPGAFMSVLSMSILDNVLDNFSRITPSELLTEARNQLVQKMTSSGHPHRDGMDIGVCRLDSVSSNVSFSGAYSRLFVVRELETANDTLEIKVNGNAELLEPEAASCQHVVYIIVGDRNSIGFIETEGLISFTEFEFNYKNGDRIYLTSDGITDLYGGENNRKFGRQRFVSLLIELGSVEIQIQREAIEKTIATWKGEQMQTDDICIMGIELSGSDQSAPS